MFNLTRSIFKNPEQLKNKLENNYTTGRYMY